jgi:hypothetical protein
MRQNSFQSTAIASAGVALSLAVISTPAHAAAFGANFETNVTDNLLLATASESLPSTIHSESVGGDSEFVGDLGLGLLLCLGIVGFFAVLESRTLRRGQALKRKIESLQSTYAKNHGLGNLPE